MAHALLVTVAELPQFGVPWAFLEQFQPRPIEVKISTGGALGTMAIEWRNVGEDDYHAAVTSSDAPWIHEPAGSFTMLTFAAGNYVVNSVYRVSLAGVVTITGGGIATVTATRYDARTNACQTATDLGVEWMQPCLVPPLTTWGASIRRAAADVVKYLLKSDVGMAPSSAQTGDENVRARYEDAEKYFKAIGASARKPQDIVDSSPSASGGGLLAEFDSDPLRGW